MDQNRVSGVTPTSDRDHSLRELIDRKQVDGLAIVLLGITQVLLATVSLMQSSWSGITVSSWSTFVLGGGGWLLIGVGVSVFQGRVVFEPESGWGIDNQRLAWIGTAAIFAVSVGAAAVAVWVSFL